MDGTGVLALYFMERQPDGSWRINGVLIAELPERVTAMMPSQGPPSIRRQANALALRCSSSQVTGNVFCALAVMAGPPILAAGRFFSAEAAPGAMSGRRLKPRARAAPQSGRR